jgi:type III secretion protein N (ATPase)
MTLNATDNYEEYLMSFNEKQKVKLVNLLQAVDPLQHKGKVVQAYGTTIRVSGLQAKIGQQCVITDKQHLESKYAVVVGLAEGQAILTPLGSLEGIEQDAEVSVVSDGATVPFCTKLTGRVLNSMGQPLDEGGSIEDVVQLPLYQTAPIPLLRKPVKDTFTTGIKAIDALLTMGIGQRTGIFAPAGGGKSTLLSMIAKHAVADVMVIALIGERGREVGEFIEHIQADGGFNRSVLVVATSDRPAMERLRAAYTATAIAEGFRSQGKHAVLLMDSITRLARAIREIGLSLGEPPVRRGFPPSVFAELPRLFERVGNDNRGSITAFYTVLVEGEETNDPIAEEVRSLLDGHIVLTSKLAQEFHYPAIDILKSTSRLINQITSVEHRSLISHIRSMMVKYQELEFLIQVGEYEPGKDYLADKAVSKIGMIKTFLQQSVNEYFSMDDSINSLKMINNE